MIKNPTTYTNISDKDFSNQDLSGCKFSSTHFQNTTFKGAILKGCEFFNCTAEDDLSLEEADMEGCIINKCRFINIDFKKAKLTHSKILNSDFSGSSLHAVKFNGTRIDGLTVHECDMNLASFDNTEICSIHYNRVRFIPYMRGIKLFRKGILNTNTIFMSGNQHLDFYDYCAYERRKDRFFNSVNNIQSPLRPIAVLVLMIFGLFTDFGQSFRRWAICTVGIIALYTLIPLFKATMSLKTALLSSLLGFFGFGEIPVGYSFFYVSESIIGYFMLGALISLLTSKLSIN